MINSLIYNIFNFEKCHRNHADLTTRKPIFVMLTLKVLYK